MYIEGINIRPLGASKGAKKANQESFKAYPHIPFHQKINLPWPQKRMILDWQQPTTSEIVVKSVRRGQFVKMCYFHIRGRYHQEQSSQLITHKSQIFPVKNSNLQFSGIVAKSSVFKTRQLRSLLSSHLRFWVSFNHLSSQRLIFRL